MKNKTFWIGFVAVWVVMQVIGEQCKRQLSGFHALVGPFEAALGDLLQVIARIQRFFVNQNLDAINPTGSSVNLHESSFQIDIDH